jgi:hypothetical protein
MEFWSYLKIIVMQLERWQDYFVWQEYEKLWNSLDIKWKLNEKLKWYLYNKDLGFEIIVLWLNVNIFNESPI